MPAPKTKKKEDVIELSIIRFGKKTTLAYLLEQIAAEKAKDGSATISTLFGSMSECISILTSLGHNKFDIVKDKKGWVGNNGKMMYSWFITILD